jgi:predicted ribosome quality control (RQC) complex YloA/Tae2 family protein
VSGEGFDIYVGRSAAQNDEVTFRIGRPDDVWLHVRGIPGAHVIVRNGGQDIPEQTLREAGGVAAYFSGARNEPAVDIELSYRRHVRKVPGGTPGLVTYRVERTLRVAPLPPWA